MPNALAFAAGAMISVAVGGPIPEAPTARQFLLCDERAFGGFAVMTLFDVAFG